MITRYALTGALGFLLLMGSYWLGRAHESADCLKKDVEAADDAIAAKGSDDALQADNARDDRNALQAENARLRRFLDERNTHAEAGRNCIERRDADGLRDDYNAIFGERLQAGRGLDGAE